MVKPTTRLGYIYGLRRDRVPSEQALPSNADKFATGRRSRMAGDLLELDLLVPNELPSPYVKGDKLAERFE